jgi:hypothetical protein
MFHNIHFCERKVFSFNQTFCHECFWFGATTFCRTTLSRMTQQKEVSCFAISSFVKEMFLAKTFCLELFLLGAATFSKMTLHRKA